MYKCRIRCMHRHPAPSVKRTFMSSSRPVFRSRWLPYLLVAPQLVITVIFFIWPAGEALWYSLQSVDPFGFSSQFVGLENFVALFTTVIISTPSGRRLNSARWSRLAACWSRCFRRHGGLRGARQPFLSDADAAALCRRARRRRRIVDFPV